MFLRSFQHDVRSASAGHESRENCILPSAALQITAVVASSDAGEIIGPCLLNLPNNRCADLVRDVNPFPNVRLAVAVDLHLVRNFLVVVVAAPSDHDGPVRLTPVPRASTMSSEDNGSMVVASFMKVPP